MRGAPARNILSDPFKAPPAHTHSFMSFRCARETARYPELIHPPFPSPRDKIHLRIIQAVLSADDVSRRILIDFYYKANFTSRTVVSKALTKVSYTILKQAQRKYKLGISRLLSLR